MKIDNNLLAIFNVIFKNRENWKFVTDDQKETFFFIINRYMSKVYPEKAQLLNLKTIDKTIALNLWFYFVNDQPYPKWFWSKSPKIDKYDIDEKDFRLLMIKLNLNKEEDLVYLLNIYPDIINDELLYYKKIEKNAKG